MEKLEWITTYSNPIPASLSLHHQAVMAEEFILVPKSAYIKNRPIADQILQNPSVREKSLQLSMLQRLEPKQQLNETDDKPPTSLKEKLMEQLKSLTYSEQQKSEYILNAIINSDRISIDNNGWLMIDQVPIDLQAASFLYNLQQTRKDFNKDIYRTILKELDIPEHMVSNSHAKQLINEKHEKSSETYTKTTTPHTPRKTTITPRQSKSKSQWGRGRKKPFVWKRL